MVYTKRDVMNFYAAVADLLVPHLQGRPLSLSNVIPTALTMIIFSRKMLPDFLTGCIGKNLRRME